MSVCELERGVRKREGADLAGHVAAPSPLTEKGSNTTKEQEENNEA